METQPENHDDEVSVRQMREAWLKGPKRQKKQEDAKDGSHQVTYSSSFKAQKNHSPILFFYFIFLSVSLFLFNVWTCYIGKNIKAF
jgi:hypothetical protein